MSFNAKTRTITLGQHPEFFADSGSAFLAELKADALTPGGAPSLACDWTVVEKWLGCEGRELSQSDYERFGLVFRSYLARGVAPSVALEPTFRKISQLAKSEARQNLPPVPPALIPVFDRMLASDEDIQQKRVHDAIQLGAAMKSLGSQTPPPRPTGPLTVASPSSSVALNWVPVVVAMVMLLMATGADWHSDWPVGFYQLLRIVVCGTAVSS